MNTQLYIEGKEIELNEQVKFVLTKQFDELSNPTIICNDYSKTVNIPFTASNNKLFGEIYKHDRQIAYGGSDGIGIYFDPHKKLDFKLIYNGDVVMTGYAKMNSITKDGGNGQYNITLNGQLGKIFQELKNINFTSKDKYDISDVFIGTINKDTIYNSWNNTPVFTTDIANAELHDIIGWTPTIHGLNVEFDSKTIEMEDHTTVSFENIVQDRYDEQNIDLNAILGNGLTDRQYGEYRSYYQTPYIYIPRMFEILKNKMYELTGYNLILDGSWFYNNNILYQYMVMLLKNFEQDNVDDKNYKYAPGYYHPSSLMSLGWTSTDYSKKKYSVGSWTMNTHNYEQPIAVFRAEDDSQGNMQYWRFPKILKGLKIRLNNVQITVNTQLTTYRVRLNANNAIKFGLTWADRYNTSQSELKIDKQVCTIVDEHSSITGLNTVKTTEFELANTVKECTVTIPYIDIDITSEELDELYAADEVDFRYLGFWIEREVNGQGLIEYYDTSSSTWKTYNQNNVIVTAETLEVDYGTALKRSNSIFNFGDIWDSDHNFFNIILNYTKMHGLVWLLNEVDKTVTIKTRQNYFSSYTIEDWTDKVDLERDFIITPVVADNKYLLFNYNDDDTDLGKKYKEQFGVNYGEKRVNTNYAFNNEDKKLFDKIPTSLVATDRLLDWNRIQDMNLKWLQLTEVMPYLKNNNKITKSFGKFYIYRGLTAFNSDARSVVITDDSPRMEFYDSYMYLGTKTNHNYWQDAGCLIRTTQYPKLDNCRLNTIALFNTPQIIYDINRTYTSRDLSIYDKYWSRFIDERYNMQNKIITCYINLTQNDYINFEFNKFILIDHQLYMVNKIYDYNLSTPETTKVDLITITDIEGYTKNNL